MGLDYSKLKAKAYKIIKKYGYEATLKTQKSTNDLINGKVTSSSYDDSIVYIIEDSYDIREIDGKTIFTYDKKLLVSSESVIPVPGNLIVMTNKTMRVINCEPISPGGIDIIYEVQARL